MRTARANRRPSRPVENLNEKLSKWHGMTPLQALQSVNADWKAEVLPIYGQRMVDGKAEMLPLEGKVGIYNPLNWQALGVAGEGYTPLSNRVLADSMSQLAEALEKPIEVTEAFNTDNGRLVGLSGKIGDGTSIIPGDDVVPIVSIVQGNAANHLLKFNFALMRLVCSNGMRAAVDGMSAIFSIRHTKTIEARYSWNFDAVLRNFAVVENNMLNNFRKFAEFKMDKAAAQAFFSEIAKIKGDKDDKAKQTVSELFEVWNHPRQVMAGETLWRAYNASTEYLQHWGFRDNESMLVANLDGKATEHKDAAYQLALTIAS